MAITKSKILKNFDVDGETKFVSIAYEIILTDDIEGELARKKFRRVFTPQDGIQAVKDWTGVTNNQNPYIVFLNAIWS